MMRVYLVQHGKAAATEEDPERGLTPGGRNETERAARFLADRGIPVREIWHSGKKRSRQTAEILAPVLKGGPEVLEKSGLAPNDNPEKTIRLLEKTEHSVLIAGHLPFLNRLAGILLTGSPGGGCIAFRNSGIVCLEREADGPRWLLAWAVFPDIL